MYRGWGSNSPPWLLAPEIHISGRTRVQLAPGRCHSKLGWGRRSTENNNQEWLEPVPPGENSPLCGDHPLDSRTTKNAQQHTISFQPHNQAL